MNTDAGISIDARGVVIWVVVPRKIFDEVDAHEEYSGKFTYHDDFWVKVAKGNNVNVVFTTYEPPEEKC